MKPAQPGAAAGAGPKIVIVGVCASGKSTLARGLQALGYDAHAIAQEHSQAPRFWAHRRPDVVIGLHCSFETIRARKDISWGRDRWRLQVRRLADAMAHAHIHLHTDGWTPEQLVEEAVRALTQLGYPPPRHNCPN